MVARFQRKNFSSEFLRDRFVITMLGVTMSGIADATDATEMRALGMRIFLDSLVSSNTIYSSLAAKTFCSYTYKFTLKILLMGF
ncbi:hypothetical protein [Tenacibaculum maritimum]|uniref:hypothetical protein n=1 Tax=Tenacibaculum maritimum TaxID=107401 RepID=UPI001E597D9D|nr:hypothetical protein [Tenacibaculum maritimum]MCD9585011.1 hypothetical protein [Tenacibaculum maritimum]MCD9620793.1 hypothetical protein [Tenacibaculum maritimum]MCD9626922.1 hypothetical protein [Tenacibaculum maritimum]MCD9629585.1 hypothetical protein [Tenacibaculum maritimum]MCD9632590.1 hypothetical protein [Tenacibaculum maritimum]